MHTYDPSINGYFDYGNTREWYAIGGYRGGQYQMVHKDLLHQSELERIKTYTNSVRRGLIVVCLEPVCSQLQSHLRGLNGVIYVSKLADLNVVSYCHRYYQVVTIGAAKGATHCSSQRALHLDEPLMANLVRTLKVLALEASIIPTNILPESL
jgi:hypothetical protein